MSLLTAARLCFTGAGARQDDRSSRVDGAVAGARRLRAPLLPRHRRRRGAARCSTRTSTSPSRTTWTSSCRTRGPRARRWCSMPSTCQRLAGRAMAGVVLTATGARTFLGQKVLRPDDAVVRDSDHRRGGGARDAAVAGFPGVPPSRRRAHPDRRRSPAVPARAAGRLPPLPHRRGHRHLLHGRALGDAGARRAGRRDAAGPGRRAADRRDDRASSASRTSMRGDEPNGPAGC